MPKKPPRHNPPNRTPRTVQSAASILRRLNAQEGLGVSLENQNLETVRASLPEGLRGHVVGVLEKPEELVIFAESAVWVARLRLAFAAQPPAGSARRTIVKLAPRGAAIR